MESGPGQQMEGIWHRTCMYVCMYVCIKPSPEDMIVDFRGRGREGKEGEKYRSVASCMLPAETKPSAQACALRPSVCGMMLQSTEPHGTGKTCIYLLLAYLFLDMYFLMAPKQS